MIWFALPIDIVLMWIKQQENIEDIHCDVNSIPFIPDDAKVCLLKENVLNFAFVYFRLELLIH